MPEHLRLETALADWLGQEECLLFSSSYGANLAALAALGDDTTVIVADAHGDVSMTGPARPGRGPVRTFVHDDPSDLERALSDTRSAPRRIVAARSR